MQAQNNETSAEERITYIRERLISYQKNGGGAYKAVEKATGVSRTAISMLANHGVTLPEEKLVKIETYLRTNYPDPM